MKSGLRRVISLKPVKHNKFCLLMGCGHKIVSNIEVAVGTLLVCIKCKNNE